MIALKNPETLLSYIKMVKLCSNKLFRPSCIRGHLGHSGEGRTDNYVPVSDFGVCTQFQVRKLLFMSTE